MDKNFSQILEKEKERQNNSIVLIASENYASKDVREAQGSIFTNKYAEGYPGARYYGGCEYVDQIEELAILRARELFGAEYVNVQPHSGAQANMAVYSALFNSEDLILSLPLDHGGHLTHGSKVNFSGKLYNFSFYEVDRESEQIDYDKLHETAKKNNPKAILSGFTSYPREIDFERIKYICDDTNSLMIVDMAHISGLVAAKLHPDCVRYADVVTSTTHKTLRGPRGGIILVGKDVPNNLGVVAPKSGRVKMISELLDSSIMPGIQGGPLMHVIAGKALAFGEALKPDFKKYCSNIISNAKILADELIKKDYSIISGGTDTHLVLIDLTNKNITGKIAEQRLELAGITTNKNMIPFDKKSPMITSGIRIGTPALTTRGMQKNEMLLIANLIDKVLSNINDDSIILAVKKEVQELCSQFELYPHLT